MTHETLYHRQRLHKQTLQRLDTDLAIHTGLAECDFMVRMLLPVLTSLYSMLSKHNWSLSLGRSGIVICDTQAAHHSLRSHHCLALEDLVTAHRTPSHGLSSAAQMLPRRERDPPWTCGHGERDKWPQHSAAAGSLLTAARS